MDGAMSKKDQEVLDRMHENWNLAEEAEKRQRELELDDYRYCAPDSQWDEQIKGIRTSRGLPCETDDQIGNFVRIAANGFAQARPQPKVSPVGDGGDVEVAKVRQGMIRCIMYKSNGDVAIDNAYLQMLRGGVGYARVLTEENEDGTLDLRVKRIPNRFQVYFDPYFEEPDGSDANFAFIAIDLPRKRFKLEYPKADLSQSGSEWVADGAEHPDWCNSKSIRIVEYYERVPYEVSYWSDGEQIIEGEVPEGVEPVSVGTRRKYKVMWYKATYNEILEQTEWPDEYIPIIPMLGEELILDGHRTFAGLIRSAKDAQKRINYYVSQQIQAIAMAPKAPWIAQADSLVNPENWANDDAQKVLFYKSVNAMGQPVPPPTRDFGQVDIGAITQAYMQAVESLKATTGMFAPALGMQTGQSGKAIDLLQQQGNTSNGHFIVAAQRFMRHLGRILNNLMFRVYDTPRVVAIIKPDEQTEMVAINQVTQDAKGRPAAYDITSGKYDVTVDIGPSYQTKRQENQQNITQLLTGPLGQVMAQIAPDLALSQFDFDMSDEVLERVKRFLAVTNPQLVQEDGNVQMPPQVQQQMQQMQQMLQQLQAQNQQLQMGAEQQMAKLQAESQIKAQSAQVDAQVELQKAQIDAEIEMQKAQLQAQIDLQKAQIQAETDLLIARLKAEADASIKAMSQAMQPQPPAVAIAIEPEEDPEMESEEDR